MFSQWDHEMSNGLLVNLSVFTHPTMRCSHGLMGKLPLWIIVTKFFWQSTCNQEKIWWSHVLTVRPWDVSWSLGQQYCFHPPHHEIFSWSHGEMTIMNNIHKILQAINMQQRENMMRSCYLIFSQWDHEMSHGLLVNLFVFTHLTMRFSHGLMVKLPLWIMFTKFFGL